MTFIPLVWKHYAIFLKVSYYLDSIIDPLKILWCTYTDTNAGTHIFERFLNLQHAYPTIWLCRKNRCKRSLMPNNSEIRLLRTLTWNTSLNNRNAGFIAHCWDIPYQHHCKIIAAIKGTNILFFLWLSERNSGWQTTGMSTLSPCPSFPCVPLCMVSPISVKDF